MLRFVYFLAVFSLASTLPALAYDFDLASDEDPTIVEFSSSDDCSFSNSLDLNFGDPEGGLGTEFDVPIGCLTNGVTETDVDDE